MGALISLFGKAALNEGTGRIEAALSKTKTATHFTGVNALVALLPGVMARDSQAIGQFVLLLITWGFALWGRGNAA